MANFVGAGIIPAYTTFAKRLGVSVQAASYFKSIHVSRATFICPTDVNMEIFSIHWTRPLCPRTILEQIWPSTGLACFHPTYGRLSAVPKVPAMPL